MGLRSVAWCAFLGLNCSLGACAEAREITVSVTVRTTAGELIADAPVGVRAYGDLALAMTDAHGRVTVELEELDDESNTLIASIGVWTHRVDKATPKEIEHVEDRYNALTDRYAIPLLEWKSLDAKTDTYDILILLTEAVRVDGRIVDGRTGKGVIAHVGTKGWHAEATTDETGRFALKGIPKDSPAVLVILPDSPLVHYHGLTADQTQDDAPLGDLVLPTIDTNGSVSIEVTDRTKLVDRNGVLIDEHVALIRSDGQYALNYHLNELGQAYDSQSGWYPRGPLQVPDGTYYAAPALWCHDTHVALRRALLEGRQSQLDAAGVPKVIVPADGTPVTLDVDATAAQDAILRVGGDLLDD